LDLRTLVDRVPSRSSWPLVAAVSGLAFLAASVLWGVPDGERLELLRTYQLAHGEQALHRLPDGSELRLDDDSRVTARCRRPKRVGALAVGTRFDVYRHHRMRIARVAEKEELPNPLQQVKAGLQTSFDGRVGSAEPVQADARPALAWSEHKIVFKHRALGEVAAEFNRYGSIPVDIEDAALRALPVSGMLDAGDTESFVAFLKTLPGVKVERTPTRVRVVKVTPTT
jgi:ferric-dicitrate binding protein FerR (iron transport regulator)